MSGDNNSGDGSTERRDFLLSSSTVLMGGGLAAGYGTFFAMAGRYLFPSSSDKAWLFVRAVGQIAPGEAIPFESPTGVRVTITRRSKSGGTKESGGTKDAKVDEFVALSSVCPHLGCRVHWEGHNDRYFCPCHNGVFNAEGIATEGPPEKAGQNLPHYPLSILDGSLYIEMSVSSVSQQNA